MNPLADVAYVIDPHEVDMWAGGLLDVFYMQEDVHGNRRIGLALAACWGSR